MDLTILAPDQDNTQVIMAVRHCPCIEGRDLHECQMQGLYPWVIWHSYSSHEHPQILQHPSHSSVAWVMSMLMHVASTCHKYSSNMRIFHYPPHWQYLVIWYLYFCDFWELFSVQAHCDGHSFASHLNLHHCDTLLPGISTLLLQVSEFLLVWTHFF